MTMVKSHTRKKFAKKPNQPSAHEITQVTDLTTAYIKHWTRNELGKLQENRDTSICIPVKNGYKIGLYNLKVHTNKTCDVIDANGELVHTFDNKINAVLYTIYTIKRRYWVSDEILALDKEINKNYVDALTLRRGIELARANKDYFKVDVKQARLEIAEKKLELFKDKMAGIHRTAKLAKVWE